ncbi:MAG: hypothetical protein LBH82_05130, partial [Bacteroidales bacterium]|nr:hypothetical protein [Bacteroidales bacterium]
MCAFAQNPRISAADIEYWVGSGTNEAILIVSFCGDDIGLAWGYRFDGTVVAGTMFDDISVADARLNIVGTPDGLSSYTYQDETYNLSEPHQAPFYSVNEMMAGIVTSQLITNGDIVEIGGDGCANTDWYSYLTFSISTIIPVTNPNATPNTYTIHAGFGNEWASETFGNISPVGDSTLVEGSS